MDLKRVKLLHTAAWLFLSSCIVFMPVAALQHRFRWAIALGSVVVLEGVVLIVNGWRCPLTDIAARYTEDRADNFDIYLPVWMARHNKTVCTTIYVLGILVSLWTYFTQVFPPSLVR